MYFLSRASKWNCSVHLRLNVLSGELLLDSLDALCHGGRRSTDGVRHVEVSQDLLAHVDRVLGHSQGLLQRRQLRGLRKEVGLLNEAVPRQVG